MFLINVINSEIGWTLDLFMVEQMKKKKQRLSSIHPPLPSYNTVAERKSNKFEMKIGKMKLVHH